ncbi:hypothetical protein B7463_g8485, partial [Scytalidium lignicola]
MATKKQTSFGQQLTAGGVAGITEVSLELLVSFGTLYRGIAAPILMETPKRATKFAANDTWARVYKSLFGIPNMTQPLSILTGASAGATEAFVVVPFELVKIRLQDVSSAGKYKGVLDCAIKVVRSEGIMTLYHGFESTVWRHIVWNAGYFGCIFQVRAMLPKPKEGAGKGSQMINDLLAGSVGGTVGTLMNTPLDVVKSRIQSMPRGATGPDVYSWTWPAVARVYREEGVRALYKGLVPKIVRFCPGGGILLVVYTAVLDLFEKMS